MRNGKPMKSGILSKMTGFTSRGFGTPSLCFMMRSMAITTIMKNAAVICVQNKSN